MNNSFEIMEDILEKLENLKEEEILDIVFDSINKLNEINKIEIILEIIEQLQDMERSKALKEFKKKNDFYNNDFHKARNNYYNYELAYNAINNIC